jgi:hypothetical protein
VRIQGRRVAHFERNREVDWVDRFTKKQKKKKKKGFDRKLEI